MPILSIESDGQGSREDLLAKPAISADLAAAETVDALLLSCVDFSLRRPATCSNSHFPRYNFDYSLEFPLVR